MRDRVKRTLAEYLSSLLVATDNLQSVSGMALGFDQWAAEVCIDYGIPFQAAVPFVGQEAIWPEQAQVRYRELLGKAQSVVIVSEGGYTADKLQRRNEYMVDLLVGPADRLVGWWDGTPGGTRNCVRYATSRGKRWVNLFEYDRAMPSSDRL
jgi:uncharacterized phage-like protein YoqJ